MTTEIKADEAILWLRAYHNETLALALRGMGLWRDLSECNVAICDSGGWEKTPAPVKMAHQRIATDLHGVREALESRALLATVATPGQKEPG